MQTKPSSGEKRLLDLYRRAFLIRAAEQRLLDLFAQGKLFGTVHTCIGQELSAVAVAAALEKGDLIFSNHRCHGHFIARNGDVQGLLAEILGRSTGVCGGRGGSQHLCAGGFFSNGILGSTAPVAAGLACALKLKDSPAIAVSFIGDGTLGEGALYEAMNLASKWDLPLLFVLENNGYAQSTSQTQTLAGEIEARASAFGIPPARAEVFKPEALVDAAAQAVGAVRRKRRPFFLRVDCDRLMAHSKGDDNRDKAEIAGYWARDPLTVFAKRAPQEAARFEAEARSAVDAAVERALASPDASGRAKGEDALESSPVKFRPAPPGSGERVAAVLYAAFKRNLAKDSRILMVGEDIEGPYGGAFKVTKTLSLEFPGRVRNTPVSESAIMGLGTGLALEGFIPVVEFMFGDFLMLAGDQFLNSAAKFQYMYNGQKTVPVVVRAPMGGRRGYGPTHSQSLEKHFLGLPQTLVLALNAGHDPGQVYDALFAGVDRPTLVIENKLLYAAPFSPKAPAGFALELGDERFPTLRVRPDGKPDATVLCYGGMLPVALEAAEALFSEDELACEIICPEQLYPFNADPLLESVRRSGRLVVAEEGQGFAAFGAEAAARLVEADPSALKGLRRVSAARHPIPSAGSLEKESLVQASDIARAARELFRG